jgi:hypothetical protein
MLLLFICIAYSRFNRRLPPVLNCRYFVDGQDTRYSSVMLGNEYITIALLSLRSSVLIMIRVQGSGIFLGASILLQRGLLTILNSMSFNILIRRRSKQTAFMKPTRNFPGLMKAYCLLLYLVPRGDQIQTKLSM